MLRKISTITISLLVMTSIMIFFLPIEISRGDDLPTADYIKVENTTARPDDQGHIIPVYANWTEDIWKVRMFIDVDLSAIDIVDANFDDCVKIPDSYQVFYNGENQYQVRLDFASGDYLPAGEGYIVNLVTNIITDEPFSFTTILDLTETLLVLYPLAPGYPDEIDGQVEIINNPPYTPDVPTGETSCLQGGDYVYHTAVTTDPDGDSVASGSGYKYDWGDGSYMPWGDRDRYHKWNDVGEFTIRVKAKDEYGAETDWSEGFNVTVVSAPPLSASQPDGPTNGETGVELCFTTNTTDPTDDDLYYKWDFGDNITDWLGPYDSGVEVEECHIWISSGTYQIRVKAKDIYDEESDWSPNATIIITSPLPELFIDTAPTVLENDGFTVTITQDYGNAFEGVTVLFNGETEQTDIYGQVTFEAPPVDQGTEYTIRASHEGYSPASKSIKVLNQIEKKGWIWGLVTDNYGELIGGARVCVIIADENNIITSECAFTDNETGLYSKSVPVGTYSVNASKKGYGSSTKNVTILESEAIPLDFVLERIENDTGPALDETQEKIDEAIVTGKVGGEIAFQKTAEDEIRYDTAVYIYDVVLTVTDIKEDSISLLVSADDDVIGNTLVVMLEGVFDSDEIGLRVNGKEISYADDLDDILNAHDDNGMAEWYLVEKDKLLYLLISFPNYSEYEITIYQIVEVLTGPIAMVIYIIISLLVVSFFVYPYIVWPSHIEKGKR